MGRRFSLVLLLIAAASPVAGTPQQHTFRAGADNVPVFVTVTDRSGRLLTDLGKSDFHVFDNGKEQSIVVFDNSPQPIRVIVLVDVSGSMAGNLGLLRSAGRQLIAHLGPDDRARVGTLGESIDISPTFTRDEGELFASLPQLIPEHAPTPLWLALDKAIHELAAADGRPVVLVMSDGKDSGPQFKQKWITQMDVIDHANQNDVMIYGVGVRSRMNTRFGGDLRGAMIESLPDPGLGKVAEESGGGYFELRSRDDLGAAFGQVLDELHHQYLIGFTPDKHDGKEHKIDVKVASKEAKVRARRAYRAQ